MILLALASALANPQPVTWQGRLLDATGTPVNGSHSAVLSIYSSPTGGPWHHQESETLSFADGYAAALLGDDPGNPLGTTWLDGRPLYLGITIDGVELLPRQRLGGALSAASASSGTGADAFGPIYATASDALADGLLAYVDYDAPNGCEGSLLADRMHYLTATCRGTGVRVPGVAGMGIDRQTGVQHGVTMQFPDGDTYDTFTASVWFKPSSTTCHAASTDCAGILWMSDQPGSSLVGFITSAVSAGLSWGSWPNSSNVSSGVTRATDLQWTVGEWHHLVVTMDADSGLSTLYLNGQVLDSRTDYSFQLGPEAAVANYYTLTGGNSNAHYARGTGDEFAIWNRPLTHAEVMALHAAQRAGRQLSLPVAGTAEAPVAFSPADGTPIGDIGEDVADHSTNGSNIAAAFDGNTDQSHTEGARKNTAAPSYIGKDWGAGVARVITRFEVYGSNNLGFSNSGGIPEANVRVHLEGSNDNFATVVNLHTSPFQEDVFSGAAAPFDETVSATDGYRYHRLRFEPVVVADGTPYPGNCCNIAEVRFYGYDAP